MSSGRQMGLPSSGPAFHCKVPIVHDRRTSVGSANLDNRSSRPNAEANLNMDDADYARGQADAFERDQEKLATRNARRMEEAAVDR